MDTPLLVTKLRIPPARPNRVPRPYLCERLNAGTNRKLTLISAPAGFGKTTLLSEWADQSGLPVAWLSLDAGDNDPVRFISYGVAALQIVHADLGAAALAQLGARQQSPIESILTLLINDIASVSQPFALVLDDYHVIENRAIDDALAFLIEHLPSPPGLHLIIASRSDPSLPLTRLRVQGQLTELRQDDLRFAPGEAARFFDQVMRLNLSTDAVAALAARTEGWIAGLQLAAVSLQGQDAGRIADYIQAFTGSNRFVMDYLVDEVLDRQPPAIQDFLLKTSILDRLSAPLCDAVLGKGEEETGRTGISPVSSSPILPLSATSSQTILEALERANLFLVPLDHERLWYRYHHLFADLLRKRLQQTNPGLVPILHDRASEWHEQNGDMPAAIEHALSARGWERAADLIERVADATLMRSEVTTLLNWIKALPDGMLRARSYLRAVHAWAMMLGGSPLDEVERQVLDAVKADRDSLASGAATTLLGVMAFYRGDMRQGIELLQHGLELLPEEKLFLRSFAVAYLGLAYQSSGDVRNASRVLREAVRLGQQAGNVMNTVLSMNHLAGQCVIQAQFHEAKALFDQALALAVDSRGRRLPVAGVPLIGLGRLLAEWNDLEVAQRYIVEGLELIRHWGEIGVMDGYTRLARVKQAQGDVAGAYAAIRTAQQLAARFEPANFVVAYVGIYTARLDIAQGNLGAAAQWAEERHLGKVVILDELAGHADGDPLPVHRTFEYVTWAQWMIAQGRPGEALEVLEPLLCATEALEWTGLSILILVQAALACQAQGNISQALSTAERALPLVQAANWVRVFLDEGEPMRKLLERMRDEGRGMKDYIGRLLAAFGNRDGLQPSSLILQPLVEPLSERELEVLRLIGDGASNPEIAQELFIAVNTVKKHVTSIFGKLEVTSRTQAVARARALGLIA